MPETLSERGKRSRRRGHQFERDMARRLKTVFPNARRGWQFRGGVEAPDIIGTPFWVECKRYKSFTAGMLKKWFLRTVDDATRGGSNLPVVLIAKEDRKQPTVTMDQVLARRLNVRFDEPDDSVTFFLITVELDVFMSCLKRKFTEVLAGYTQ